MIFFYGLNVFITISTTIPCNKRLRDDDIVLWDLSGREKWMCKEIKNTFLNTEFSMFENRIENINTFVFVTIKKTKLGECQNR